MVILKSLDLSRNKKDFTGKLQARISTIHRKIKFIYTKIYFELEREIFLEISLTP